MIRRYLGEMGVMPSLLDMAEGVPHESIRALSREEMRRFNIDLRSVVESDWIYDDRLVDRGVILKSIDASDAGGAAFRKTVLRVSCAAPGELLVGYAHELGSRDSALLPLKFVAAEEEFNLAPAAQPVSAADAGRHYDIRRTPVPLRAFETAAALDRLALAPAPEGNRAGGVRRLSTLGLAPALSALARHCGQGAASAGGTGLVPRQRP
jgi:hypothetical protein